MFLPFLVFLTAAESAPSLQASCAMRLHKNGTKIGRVTFTSQGNDQRLEVILKGDPGKITPGYHALTVRSKPARGNPVNCDNTGGIFKRGEKVLGDFGGVRGGERGEVNQYHIITVDPDAVEEVWGLTEGLIQCPPVPYKVWPDGREERIVNLDQAMETVNRLTLEGEHSFYILYKKPDCYLPVSNRDVHTLNKPMFYLSGRNSIVGKAVVLQKGPKDVGSGKPGEAIACCNLTLDD